jgi:hypothetical protein
VQLTRSRRGILKKVAKSDERKFAVFAKIENVCSEEWLQEFVTVVEAERLHTRAPDDERSARVQELRKPFGFRNPQWEELKARMRPGDELWTFASPAGSWQHLAGRRGIALVRNKRIVCAIVTLMN